MKKSSENVKGKPKKDKTLLPQQKKVMKIILGIFIFLVVLSIVLSGLTWADII